MSQISHWIDLSQVYNSKRPFYKVLSEDKSDVSKVKEGNRDGTKFFMPGCPSDGRPAELRKVSNGTARIPNGCSICQTGQNPRAPGARNLCFIGGKHNNPRSFRFCAITCNKTLFFGNKA